MADASTAGDASNGLMQKADVKAISVEKPATGLFSRAASTSRQPGASA
jgi:hypothetical protein